MKNIPLYFLLTGYLLLASCKEEAPDPLSQLPPATQTGAETFGCLVNGEAWVPKGRIGITTNLTEYYNHGDFNVHASSRGFGCAIALFGYGYSLLLETVI